jgi:hypothetical protein
MVMAEIIMVSYSMRLNSPLMLVTGSRVESARAARSRTFEGRQDDKPLLARRPRLLRRRQTKLPQPRSTPGTAGTTAAQIGLKPAAHRCSVATRSGDRAEVSIAPSTFSARWRHYEKKLGSPRETCKRRR